MGSRRKDIGFSAIEMSGGSDQDVVPLVRHQPCCRASSERMKENSAICPRPIATVRAVRAG